MQILAQQALLLILTPGMKISSVVSGQLLLKKRYFTNTTPVTGEAICEIPRSSAADIEPALDAAHKAKDSWGRTSVTERCNILLKIADRIEANLESLSLAETWDNGKPIRECLNADLPLVVDHFRYFAGCIRAQEGSSAELDATTAYYHFHENLRCSRANYPMELPYLDSGMISGQKAQLRKNNWVQRRLH